MLVIDIQAWLPGCWIAEPKVFLVDVILITDSLLSRHFKNAVSVDHVPATLIEVLFRLLLLLIDDLGLRRDALYLVSCAFVSRIKLLHLDVFNRLNFIIGPHRLVLQ